MRRDLLSSDGSDSEEGGGAPVEPSALKVNEDFARRFEHNKKREERQRLEEKLGSASRKRKRHDEQGDDGDLSEDSTSESEDEDEGELATEALDSEIIATLQAIRSKDPRVYDTTVKFYSEDRDDGKTTSKSKKEKPMRLQDYHRQNLLKGPHATDEDASVPMTYNQEQEQLKNSILGEINAAAAGSSSEDEAGQDAEENDKFLVAKKTERPIPRTVVEVDIETADKDPETFLSNFMHSRAWAAPSADPHPFESDDDEEEKRAEEFEEAYNLRFEDPAKSNETLRSHARDLAAKYSVRREEANPRQKRRDAEKAQKEAEKQQRREEKARLRKLRIEEVEEKVRRIKRAAGIRTADLQPEDWSRFVDDDWDDAKWEEEMQKRFGEEYYAEQDVDSEDESRGSKPRKPKFDDDLDIKDIIPDFDDEQQAEFSLSEEEGAAAAVDDHGSNTKTAKKSSKKKDKKAAADEKKREAKKERRIIEQLVEDQLQLELNDTIPRGQGQKGGDGAGPSGFRYRETSPKSFGLTARDILLADDKQLNEYAGLKKLATFRDPEKKKKDAKHLGKKGRLRKWRLETFGNEEGVTAADLLGATAAASGTSAAVDDERDDDAGAGAGTQAKGDGKAKKKRRRRAKKQKVEGQGEGEVVEA